MKKIVLGVITLCALGFANDASVKKESECPVLVKVHTEKERKELSENIESLKALSPAVYNAYINILNAYDKDATYESYVYNRDITSTYVWGVATAVEYTYIYSKSDESKKNIKNFYENFLKNIDKSNEDWCNTGAESVD